MNLVVGVEVWARLQYSILNFGTRIYDILQDFKAGDVYKFIVDVDPLSFQDPDVVEGIGSAKTIFVNAVMGLMPHFKQGTSKMDEVIDSNNTAQKFFGGGDTLQEFKRSAHFSFFQIFTGRSIDFLSIM